MRTYDDSFSGQKIYPGKVRFVPSAKDPSMNSVPFDIRQRQICASMENGHQGKISEDIC
jgi:hypothetical protein